MSFLTAEWRKLVLANYEISPDLLKPYIPPHTELDLWNGTCYVSLVGFMFVNTKVLGLSIPYHKNFEEVNLRFYVRHKYQGEWRRGVVFIKEIVPRAAITFVANTIYKEHYETMKMNHQWLEHKDHRHVRYEWVKNGRLNYINVNASLKPQPIAQDSETEFITEHYWGYTKNGDNASLEYEVTHPRWSAYDILQYQIDVDFERVYGDTFADLTNQIPRSVMLAEGSEITVENKRKIS